MILCAPLQIVTDVQWKAMNATEFASYKAIILGDPNITPTNASAVNSAGKFVLFSQNSSPLHTPPPSCWLRTIS